MQQQLISNHIILTPVDNDNVAEKQMKVVTEGKKGSKQKDTNNKSTLLLAKSDRGTRKL